MSAVRVGNAFVDDLACKPCVSPPYRLFTGAGLKLPSQTALDPASRIIVTSMMAPAQIPMTATVISVAVIGKPALPSRRRTEAATDGPCVERSR
jgi:hypothetical protein